jgi:hypothetical protein
MVISIHAIRACVIVTIHAVLVVSMVCRRRWNGTKKCQLSGYMHSIPTNLQVYVYTCGS